VTPEECIELWSGSLDENGLINVGSVCRGQPVWVSYYLVDRTPERYDGDTYFVSIKKRERKAFPMLADFQDVAYTIVRDVDDKGTQVRVHVVAQLDRMTKIVMEVDDDNADVQSTGDN
jgi:hypothetical protein